MLGEERTCLKMKSILKKAEVREGERHSPECEHLDSAIPEIQFLPEFSILRINKFFLCLISFGFQSPAIENLVDNKGSKICRQSSLGTFPLRDVGRCFLHS